MTINRYIPLYSTESTAAPSASDLYVGELAVNVTDGAIYTRNTLDQIVLLTPRNVQSASWSSGSVSSSYALSASWAPGGGASVSASYAQTASYLNVVSGSDIGFIPVWSFNGAQTSSYLYQDSNRSFIVGGTASLHPGTPTRFVIDAGKTTSYNHTHFHGEINSYLQILGENRDTGSNASIDFVAQNDIGDENGGYIDMGINSSGFTDPNFVGGATDAYLYNTGSDLYIGNASPDKKVYFFNGGPNAGATTRVYFDATGTVGINTTTATPGAPEALIVYGLPTGQYNLITGVSNVDLYAQLNIHNLNSGPSASSDVVATAPYGNENLGYIDMGIASENYAWTGWPYGKYDAYLMSRAYNNLVIGTNSDIPLSGNIVFFAGNDYNYHPLILGATGSHTMSGSLNVLGGTITASHFVGTASQAISSSWALTASYVAGEITSASFAETASFVLTASYALSSAGTSINAQTASLAWYVSGSGIGTFTGSLSGSATIAETASFVSGAYTAGWALSASWAPGAFDATVVRGYSGTFTGSATGALQGTASWAPSASFANSASFVSGAYTAKWSATTDTASFVSGAYTAKWSATADTASFVSGAYTAKWAATTDTASFVSGAYTAKWALTASNALLATTASFVSGAYTAQWALTASHAEHALTASFVSGAYTAQWAKTTDTASFVSGAYTAQWAKVADTASFVSGAYTAQWALTASHAEHAATASFVSGAYTAQWAKVTDTASFVSGAYTAQWAKTTDTASFVSASYVSKWAQTTDTASFVSGAYTSQWALSSSFVSHSYTADWSLNALSVIGNAGTATTLQTARLINGTSFDGSANIIVTASYTTLTGVPIGLVSQSVQINSGTFSGSLTGSLLGTSSWANSASFVSGAYTAQWARTTDTASFVSGAYTAQWARVADTASFVSGAYTAQWARTTDTASFVSGAYTAQWAKTADTSSFVSGAYTAQWALSSSWTQTASYASSGRATCIPIYNGAFGGNVQMTNISGVLVEWNVSQRTLADLTGYSSYKVVVEVVSGSLNGTSRLSVQFATTPLQNSWSFFGSQSGVPLYVTGVATSSYAAIPAVASADNVYLRWVTWSGSLSQARIGTINLWVK